MNAINEEPEHQEIEALLPWYAAGTLSRRDTHRVEQALAGTGTAIWIWSARSLPVFTEAAQRPELGMPQLPAGQPPVAYH